MSELDVHDTVQAELKAAFAEKGLADPKGKPLDSESIVVVGRGEADSPTTQNLKTHSGTKKEKKRRAKKNAKQDITRPTDEAIHNKQQVIESLNEEIKSGGVHLNHVDLPEGDEHGRSFSRSESEDEGESGSDWSDNEDEDQTSENRVSASDKDSKQAKTDKNSASIRSAPSAQRDTSSKKPTNVFILSAVYNLLSQNLAVAPSLIKNAVPLLLVFVLSSVFTLYKSITAKLDGAHSVLEAYLPAIAFGIIQNLVNYLKQANKYISDRVSSLEDQSAAYEAATESFSKSQESLQTFLDDYKSIETSARNYSITWKPKVNFNLVSVILIRTSTRVASYVYSKTGLSKTSSK